MSTLAKNYSITVSRGATDTKTRSTSVFWEKAEFYRFGITPMLLGIIAILGGVAGAVAIEDSALKLGAISVSTAVALSMILGVMPMRAIVVSCSIAVLIDLLVLIF